MAGSRMPIVTAHGEGRPFSTKVDLEKAIVALRFVDNRGEPTEIYPYNPNGSPAGHHRPDHRRRPLHHRHAAPGARVPHVQMSWAPDDAGEDSPWMQLFYNARAWVG